MAEAVASEPLVAESDEALARILQGQEREAAEREARRLGRARPAGVRVGIRAERRRSRSDRCDGAELRSTAPRGAVRSKAAVSCGGEGGRRKARCRSGDSDTTALIALPTPAPIVQRRRQPSLELEPLIEVSCGEKRSIRSRARSDSARKLAAVEGNARSSAAQAKATVTMADS